MNPTKEETKRRYIDIYRDYIVGLNTSELCEKYKLGMQSIKKIVSLVAKYFNTNLEPEDQIQIAMDKSQVRKELLMGLFKTTESDKVKLNCMKELRMEEELGCKLRGLLKQTTVNIDNRKQMFIMSNIGGGRQQQALPQEKPTLSLKATIQEKNKI